MSVVKDYSRDKLFDQLGLIRLRESYMLDSESSPQDRFAFVAEKFAANPEHAQRIYNYASKHWLSFATPILSFGRTQRGLPISCFLVYMQDSTNGLINTLSEVNWLSVMGGGVGVQMAIRSADDKSVGIMPHLRVYDASSNAYRQGKTRRGSYAMYLDISHPDILLFIEMRKPTGDPNMRALNLHHGINIPDAFMELVEKSMLDPHFDDTWELKDPHNGVVRAKVSARELWQRIIEMRMQTGEPYLHFIDTSNRHLPQFLKDRGLKVTQSNLCSEIILPTNSERTAVCCLSSFNLEYYDDWKDDQLFLKDVALFMDRVLQHFIDNAPDTISRARFSAFRERSIGLGALGFHAYLQRNNVPFESAQALYINEQIFAHISSGLEKANFELGAEYGEAPDAEGTGRRFSHMMAIAPNASSSIIMGNTSPSIEPFRANAYRQDTLSGSHLTKNKYLDVILRAYHEEHGGDVDDTWRSIITNDGSVQHLDFLSPEVKAVFKTAMEIDQRWIIEHAATRQQYIDQGQSVNVFFPPNTHVKYLHTVHFLAWKKGLKTLYYCRSDKIRKADKVAQQIERRVIEELNMKELINEEATCLACEG